MIDLGEHEIDVNSREQDKMFLCYSVQSAFTCGVQQKGRGSRALIRQRGPKCRFRV